MNIEDDTLCDVCYHSGVTTVEMVGIQVCADCLWSASQAMARHMQSHGLTDTDESANAISDAWRLAEAAMLAATEGE